MTENNYQTTHIFGKQVELRWVALGALVIQTVAVVVTLRMSKSSTTGEGYINTTAVVMSELVKLLCSFFLLARDSGGYTQAMYEVNDKIIKSPMETLKVGIPAALYTVQNNLIFVALSNMPAPMYQVTYQLKILTTALLSILMLSRLISAQQWFGLFMLFLGVATIQYNPDADTEIKPHTNLMVGLIAVLAACVTSGLAGVYFEKILKGSSTSIWLRNIQLGLYGTILGLIGCLWIDGDRIVAEGFFTEYNHLTILAILLQSAGGLIVAMVLKYADNILKCFGNGAAIVLSCLVSSMLGDYEPTALFGVGTIFVMVAIFLYNLSLEQIYKILGMNQKREVDVNGTLENGDKAVAIEPKTELK